jgi:hypothetical protein
MTPIEKAIELKHKMYAKILDYNIDYTDSNNIEQLNIFHDKAKQCALIAVEEVAKCTKYEKQKFENDRFSEEYWDEVKQEIENL